MARYHPDHYGRLVRDPESNAIHACATDPDPDGRTGWGNVGARRRINLTRAARKNEIKQNLGDGPSAGRWHQHRAGRLGNTITNNTSTGNGVLPLHFDLADHNPNVDLVPPCESNTRQSNTEITKSQPCID